MNTNANALHIDYNDFHKLCLDALIAYSPEYKNLHYTKCSNQLRVKEFEDLPEHLLSYWKKRNANHSDDKLNAGLVIDGFVIAQSKTEPEEKLLTPPKEYLKMLNALFPEVTEGQSAEMLYKMHIDTHKEHETQEHRFSYKSFKEVFEFLKTQGLIATHKHQEAA